MQTKNPFPTLFNGHPMRESTISEAEKAAEASKLLAALLQRLQNTEK